MVLGKAKIYLAKSLLYYHCHGKVPLHVEPIIQECFTAAWLHSIRKPQNQDPTSLFSVSSDRALDGADAIYLYVKGFV